MIDEIIKKRVLKLNKNYIFVCTGPPGSGKSWACISIAELVDPNFSIENITTPLDDEKGLIPLLNSEKFKRGDAIVMEEAGVDLSAKEWQSFINKAVNKVLQTFRWEGIALLMNVPVDAFVDKWARVLWQGYGEMVYVNEESGISLMKFFDMSYSGRYQTIFYKYPYKVINGRWVQQRSFAIPKPSDDLLMEYEPLHKRFKKNIRKDLGEELKKRKEKQLEKELKKRMPVDVETCVKSVLDDKGTYLNTYKQRTFLDADLIRDKFNCTKAEARIIKKRGEKGLGLI